LIRPKEADLMLLSITRRPKLQAEKGKLERAPPDRLPYEKDSKRI
jgi:hypothetical protein